MKPATEEQVSDKVLTLPNVVTLVRLLLLPLSMWLLFGLHSQVAAFFVYVVAASTDWVDGQIARRTGQVSKVGKLFDPFVDVLLLCVGVISTCVLGRLPVWIVVCLVFRELDLVLLGRAMLRTVGAVPSVVYVGKFATAFLMAGLCMLILGWPLTPGIGFGWAPSWLPGLGAADTYLGIWFLYVGCVLSVVAYSIYHVKGIRMFLAWKRGTDV